MPANDTLQPREAAFIATNAYFTLKDWMNFSKEQNVKPVAATEERGNIEDRVLGTGTAGTHQQRHNTSLKRLDKPLASTALGNVHTAKTGFNAESGFGYTLTFKAQEKKHVVVAVRGTRPEMGSADLLTDAYGSLTTFGSVGIVHRGFKQCFESMLPGVERDRALMASADVVHFVGHSLGGAVATLLAAHYKGVAKSVKLYSFGSPRVGAFPTHTSIERLIGPENIFRVAHDLDVISLVGPYPYVHVNGSPRGPGFMTLKSPFNLGLDNHDMMAYIDTVGRRSWSQLVTASEQVNHDESILARALLHGGGDDPGWVRRGCATTLTWLLKLFSIRLKMMTTKAVLALTAVDLLAELVCTGAHKLLKLGEDIMYLMRMTAKWANITIAKGASFTASIIKAILDRMLATLRSMAMTALTRAAVGLTPMGLIIPAWGLMAASAF